MLGVGIALGFLSLALAWSVYYSGGIWPEDWSITVIIVGGIFSLYWLFTRPSHYAPPRRFWMRLVVFLLPCYILFQLVPLRISVLQVLSPARANLSRLLQPVAAGTISAPISVNVDATVLCFFSTLAYIATFLLVRQIAWRFSTRPWLPVIPLIVIGAAEAAIGISQMLGSPPADAATGTYPNRNHFAGLLEMVLPFATLGGFAFLRKNGRRDSSALPAMKACAMWTVAGALLAAIVYSLSRMGFLSAFCTLFAMAALSLGSRLRPKARLWASIALMVGMVLLPILFAPAQLIERFTEASSTNEIRLFLWRNSLPIIGDFRLFGCGLGGFESIFPRYQQVATNYRVEFVHNDYLQYLAELGFAGFALLACVVVSILLEIFRGIRKLPEGDRRFVVISCGAAFFSILLHSVVDFNTYIPANALMLAWIGGVGSAGGLD